MQSQLNVRLVKVTNTSDEPIELCPSFIGKKGTKSFKHGKIVVQPNQSSHPLPYSALLGSEGWASLISKGRISIEDVDWRSTVGTIENLSKEQLSFEVFDGNGNGLRQITVDSGKKSGFLPLNKIKRYKRLESLAAQKQIRLKPHPYIGPPPPLAPSRCMGSYGNEEVYLCYECGAPIVFRFHPPRPIHV